MKNLLLALHIFMPTYLLAQSDYVTAAGKFMRYYNNNQADSLFSMYAASVKTALPLDKTTQMLSMMRSQFGSLKTLIPQTKAAAYTSFKGDFDKTTLTVILALNKDNQLEGLQFMPYSSPGGNNKEEDNIISGDIHGTLTLAANNNKQPVVLIIAGSGPTDRNGNSAVGLASNTYKLLADSLQQHGIASLRYDKRGIGKSAAGMHSEADLSFEDLINDAVALVKLLKADNRFSKVYIAGHSEGSLIGMIAAQREPVDGYISVAGMGEPFSTTLKRQVQQLLPPSQSAISATLIDSLASGHTVHCPDNLAMYFRNSVQPYMISIMKYNPQQEIKKLHTPVLILQGTTDLQVTIHDAELLKQAAPKAILKKIDGMNHVLKTAPMDKAANLATYNKPDLPLQPELVSGITAFISTR
ncbi:MAG TPA: alpha/beta fold hydrolase [Chitinophaga sp.]|uniref:alpha/beta fold hydrolase n=1 Tax=Chitinophaga sp. TaxID=1869181 RepID=UPI002B6A2AC6|nr:alpha/beta fold hydrolase [Chitinophaga sp.]HVI44005.1 alpha/beta fold hydrolase [Chitinophaga sp.]